VFNLDVWASILMFGTMSIIEKGKWKLIMIEVTHASMSNNGTCCTPYTHAIQRVGAR